MGRGRNHVAYGGKTRRKSTGRSPACKPGSVSTRTRERVPVPDGHSSRRSVTRTLQQPTRGSMSCDTAGETGRLSPLIWPCSGWGLPCRQRYRRRGGLLPHRFTLTATCVEAVCFLLHCPSHEARAACAQELPGNLPCGARTFLGAPGLHRVHRDRPADDLPCRNIAAPQPPSVGLPVRAPRRAYSTPPSQTRSLEVAVHPRIISSGNESNAPPLTTPHTPDASLTHRPSLRPVDPDLTNTTARPLRRERRQ